MNPVLLISVLSELESSGYEFVRCESCMWGSDLVISLWGEASGKRVSSRWKVTSLELTNAYSPMTLVDAALLKLKGQMLEHLA